MVELWTAVAVEPGHHCSGDLPLASSPAVLLEICSNLLVEIKSDTTSEVQFAHFSIKEFLFPGNRSEIPPGLDEQQSKVLQFYRTNPSEAHIQLSISCLTYLSFEDLGAFPDDLDRDSFVAFFSAKNANLLSYATNFTAFHTDNVHQVNSEILILIRRILQSRSISLKLFIYAYHCYGKLGSYTDFDELSLAYEWYRFTSTVTRAATNTSNEKESTIPQAIFSGLRYFHYCSNNTLRLLFNPIDQLSKWVATFTESPIYSDDREIYNEALDISYDDYQTMLFHVYAYGSLAAIKSFHEDPFIKHDQETEFQVAILCGRVDIFDFIIVRGEIPVNTRHISLAVTVNYMLYHLAQAKPLKEYLKIRGGVLALCEASRRIESTCLTYHSLSALYKTVDNMTPELLNIPLCQLRETNQFLKAGRKVLQKDLLGEFTAVGRSDWTGLGLECSEDKTVNMIVLSTSGTVRALEDIALRSLLKHILETTSRSITELYYTMVRFRMRKTLTAESCREFLLQAGQFPTHTEPIAGDLANVKATWSVQRTAHTGNSHFFCDEQVSRRAMTSVPVCTRCSDFTAVAKMPCRTELDYVNDIVQSVGNFTKAVESCFQPSQELTSLLQGGLLCALKVSEL